MKPIFNYHINEKFCQLIILKRYNTVIAETTHFYENEIKEMTCINTVTTSNFVADIADNESLFSFETFFD